MLILQAFILSPGETFLNLGFITIRWYGLLISVSVLIGLFVSKKLAKARNINPEYISEILPSLIISSIIGARAYYVIFELKKKEVLNTPSKVENWLLSTDKISIDGQIWESKKAVFSNDLLESKQVKLAINSLKVISEAEKLRFKSSINYLILEEKVSIPFWLGDRTLTKSGEFFDFENRWNLGYENLDKDGYFIGRKFNSIDIFNDFVLDLEPQFLIQRLLKGHTNSFVKKDESITSDRVKRNSSFEDYFAIKSQIKGPIKNWDLAIDKNLNSLDFNKFPDAFNDLPKNSRGDLLLSATV